MMIMGNVRGVDPEYGFRRFHPEKHTYTCHITSHSNRHTLTFLCIIDVENKFAGGNSRPEELMAHHAPIALL